MSAAGFRHEALLYEGESGFLEAIVPFIRDGVRAREPTLVVVSGARIERLRAELGGETAGVAFADMEEIGHNPAWIIPAWQEFVDRNAGSGRQLRGIGEPIWAARRDPELSECQRHESLLNLALAGAERFWLLCPYDRGSLSASVIEEAQRSHPFARQNDRSWASPAYAGLAASATWARPLPAPPGSARRLDFDAHSLQPMRAAVIHDGARAGLPSGRLADLVLAVSEVASNSVRHGGGQGTLRVWRDDEAVVCEVRDEGRVADPLADRERPGRGLHSPRGLWLANQLCDLVQLRSQDDGTAVRLRMRTG
jgi:anti-sigma regulatory factor (Ser/Thr protein kinase)